MKLLIATGIYPPSIGGPATYAKLLKDELPKRGIDVEVLSFDEVRKYPKGLSHLILFFKLIARAKGKDLIFLQDIVSVGLFVYIYHLFTGKKYIVRVPGDHAWEQAKTRFGVMDSIDEFQKNKHNFYIEILKKVRKIVVSSADKIIVPSNWFKQIVNNWITDKEKIKVIYNGINLNEYKNVEPNEYDERAIITAGRLVKWKEFDSLVKIFADPRMDNFNLYIAGSGPEYDNLKKIIKDLNLELRVFLLGKMDKKLLMDRISNSNIFILNSSFESFSFQLVEAMATETPVIAPRICNIPEIVENGVDGILFEFGDTEGMIDSIEKVSKNLDFRAKLVKNALEKSKKFSIKNTVEEVAKIINIYG